MYQKEKVKGKIFMLLSEAMLNLVVFPPPPPKGCRGTRIYELHRYVPQGRVWFLRFSILK